MFLLLLTRSAWPFFTMFFAPFCAPLWKYFPNSALGSRNMKTKLGLLHESLNKSNKSIATPPSLSPSKLADIHAPRFTAAAEDAPSLSRSTSEAAPSSPSSSCCCSLRPRGDEGGSFYVPMLPRERLKNHVGEGGRLHFLIKEMLSKGEKVGEWRKGDKGGRGRQRP